MTPLQSRLTLMVDEWLGIALCLWLWRQKDYTALAVAATGLVVFVYLVGYPMHWKLERRWAEHEARR